VTARSGLPPMVSVYDGRACLGFILARGRADFEAFDSSHRVLAPHRSSRARYFAAAIGGTQRTAAE
jgi:hypothetical protein